MSRFASSLVLAVSASLVVGSACSRAERDQGSTVTGQPGGCDGAGCSANCASDDDCEGSYCEGGECRNDCSSAASVCLTECDERGRCNRAPFALTSGPFLSNGAAAPADAGTTCIELDVPFEPVTPTVVLLIDQSGSMDEVFESGQSRWDTLVSTLTNPQTSLLNSLESSVRFGLTLYTSQQGFGPPSSPRTCPMLSQVSISLGNFARISSVLQAARPVQDTPTAESVQAVAQALTAFSEEGPKSIILATDGEPDTCLDPDAHNEASRGLSVQAVTDAFAAGIRTHVISVGDDVGADHLKALAVAGAGGDGTAEAFTALDSQGLVSAFEAIINGVRSCDFRLDGRVLAADAVRGTVSLDGRPLAFQDPDGWIMTDESTVRIQGVACEELLESASDLAIRFPCDAFLRLQ